MRLFQNIDAHRDPVTRINGSFADHCTFVMQSCTKIMYEMDELDKINSLITIYDRKKNATE